MDTLQTLALALGLSALSGVRLYLTVFLTSLAINQGWLHLAPEYSSLESLGNPAITVTAGVLFALEFFADKVPWVDSLWDSVHTIVRPAGAVLLTLTVLGDFNPEVKIIAGLCAGGIALTMHTAKASTRLLVNTSPEPFSNIGLSLAEDAIVGGLFALLIAHPFVGAGVALVALAAALYMLPRLWRMVKGAGSFIRRKLFTPRERSLA